MTAGVAALAYAGIPVTHRGLATAVAFVTGRTGEDDELDWPALAAFPGTLVFYMGVQRLGRISASLIEAGRDAASRRPSSKRGRSPASADQRHARDDRRAGRRAEVGSPSITVVGAVAALSEQLAWLPARPLAGLTVAVTRARAQASGLAIRLRQLGAEVVQAPSCGRSRCPGLRSIRRRTTSSA